MPDYAVIIPAYNEEEFLGETVATTRQAMEVLRRDENPLDGILIVVDNNSTDRTAEVARSTGADQVVFEAHNQIAKARNAGAASTDMEYLVFVDADTRINPVTLRRALEMLQSGEVAAGGARLVMDQQVTRMVGWLVDSWNRIAVWFHYAAGSFFFCRRDAFEAAGGFAEDVYAGEEVWLARRIKRWARSRRMTFQVIADPPIVTSGRKSDWFSTWDFVRQLAILFLIPGATKSKRLCGIWYRRPEEERPGV